LSALTRGIAARSASTAAFGAPGSITITRWIAPSVLMIRTVKRSAPSDTTSTVAPLSLKNATSSSAALRLSPSSSNGALLSEIGDVTPGIVILSRYVARTARRSRNQLRAAGRQLL
jgi:hypothetical protein